MRWSAGLFVYGLRAYTCVLAMCSQSYSTCIMHLLCSVASSLYNVDTASRTIYQEREKLSGVHWTLLGEVCKFMHSSQFDDSREKSTKVAMSRNFKILEQIHAAAHDRCTSGLPQSLNHTCQIVKTSGSVGDELPVGVSGFCYPRAQGLGLDLWREWCMSGEELERWLRGSRGWQMTK